jgi:hypothetical protein
VELGGRAIAFDITRNRNDGPDMFLPMEGKPRLGIDLVDESGGLICRTVWWSRKDDKRGGKLGTTLAFGAGSEPLKWVWILPTTPRLFVNPDGQVLLMLNEDKLLGVGTAGRKIRSASLRLSLTTQGTEEVKVRWTKVLVRRLDTWPEFPKEVVGAERGAGGPVIGEP